MTRDQAELLFCVGFSVWFLGVHLLSTRALWMSLWVVALWPVAIPAVFLALLVRESLLRTLELLVKLIWRGK